MENTPPDIVSFLRAEFAKRCRSNPRYSLRAYAKSLDLDQSLLSKILRGTRQLSNRKLDDVGRRLGLSPAEIQALSRETKSRSESYSYQQVAEDVFNVISDWYHFALLELLKVESPKCSSGRLASRLGIHATEVDEALARLERLGYLQATEQGWVLQSPNNSWSDLEVTTAARRNLQKSLLRKSIDAIDNMNFEVRENGSLTIACDEALIPEIRKKIKKFRQELDSFTQAHGNYNQVYQVVTSFFPLTQKLEEIPV